MQEAHNKLKEIIWEITDECHNGCDYCGSAHILNKIKPSHDDICDIVESISEYPPEELNISGGNALEVHVNTHEYIIKVLSNKVKLKILVNPRSIDLDDQYHAYILGLYDWIGVSVNNEEELEDLKSKLYILPKRITIITNFNTNNIWDYKAIEGFVKESDLSWQIQYTMYDKKHRNAIYSNDAAKDLLAKRVNDSIKNGINVILADNMNNGTCSAGKYSCGILANGNVIPCLSMRSWIKCDTIFDANIAGNINDMSLKEIWEKGFASFRCNEFRCCKDICNAPIEITETPAPVTIALKQTNDGWVKTEPLNWPNMVMAYGVQVPAQPIQTLYGVTVPGWKGKTPFDVPPANTYMYGVFSNDKIFDGPGTSGGYLNVTNGTTGIGSATTRKGWSDYEL